MSKMSHLGSLSEGGEEGRVHPAGVVSCTATRLHDEMHKMSHLGSLSEGGEEGGVHPAGVASSATRLHDEMHKMSLSPWESV